MNNDYDEKTKMLKIVDTIYRIKEPTILYYFEEYFDFDSMENLDAKYDMVKSLAESGEICGKGYERLFEKLPPNSKFIEDGIKTNDKIFHIMVD